jgi:hypothetical protein
MLFLFHTYLFPKFSHTISFSTSIFSQQLKNRIFRKKENDRGSLHSILLAFSQSYVKHDLRKNKITVASTTLFLGINTKFEALAPNLKH